MFSNIDHKDGKIHCTDYHLTSMGHDRCRRPKWKENVFVVDRKFLDENQIEHIHVDMVKQVVRLVAENE